MKATLEFTLPEETEDHTLAIKAGDILSTLHQLNMWLRHQIKYEELPPEKDVILQEVREKLFEFARDNDISGLL